MIYCFHFTTNFNQSIAVAKMHWKLQLFVKCQTKNLCFSDGPKGCDKISSFFSLFVVFNTNKLHSALSFVSICNNCGSNYTQHACLMWLSGWALCTWSSLLMLCVVSAFDSCAHKSQEKIKNWLKLMTSGNASTTRCNDRCYFLQYFSSSSFEI